MARRRHRRTHHAERDDPSSHIARDPLSDIFDDPITRSLPPLFTNQPSLVRSSLPEIEDLRTFHPDRVTPARSPRRRARIVTRPARASKQPAKWSRPDFPYFAAPQHVPICVRRQERRQVLFAKRRTGKGARTPKRFNFYSKVRC